MTDLTGKNNTQPVAHLIQKYGYEVEIYEDIPTDDGHLLALLRIPHGKTNKTGPRKPVVLLVHGFMSSSIDFVLTGPDRALGFLLSERGYDVWLANSRGEKYFRKHIDLDADKHTDYWKFSFHEIGVYDLPAILHQIETVTGLKTLTCIAHSIGTCAGLALLCDRPEYNERISLLIALSPQAIIPNVSIPYRVLNATRHIWLDPMVKVGSLEFFPNNIQRGISYIRKRFSKGSLLEAITMQFCYLLNGKSSQPIIQEDVRGLVNHYPNTSSLLVLNHLGQLYRSGSFIKYDHGSEMNIQKYGTQEPPLYDLSKVVCPVVLFCSSADPNGLPKNSRHLSRMLPNCIAVHAMENPTFNHSDYLFGKSAVKELYPLIFEYMNKYCQVL